MQTIRINISDTLPHEKITLLIKEIENIFNKEGLDFQINRDISSKNDSWDKLNIEEIAVDTGIEDFAENHDYYLYGTPKRT